MTAGFGFDRYSKDDRIMDRSAQGLWQRRERRERGVCTFYRCRLRDLYSKTDDAHGRDSLRVALFPVAKIPGRGMRRVLILFVLNGIIGDVGK